MKIFFLFLSMLFFLSLKGQECSFCTGIGGDFKLLEWEGIKMDTSLVKTNGVYISKHDGGRGEYFFIRFLDSGRVYFSCYYCSFPNDTELNNLNYGHYGYYVVENNEIKIERYGEGLGYYISYYSINSDYIMQNAFSYRKKGGGKRIPLQSETYKYIYFKANLRSKSFW